MVPDVSSGTALARSRTVSLSHLLAFVPCSMAVGRRPSTPACYVSDGSGGDCKCSAVNAVNASCGLTLGVSAVEIGIRYVTNGSHDASPALTAEFPRHTEVTTACFIIHS